MELKVQKKEFLGVLSKCAGVADKKSTMPILADVLIEAFDELTLSATDLSLAVRGTVPATIVAKGRWCVPARDLLDRVSTMPDGEIVLAVSGTSFEVRSAVAKRKFRLSAIPGDEFPTMPEPEGSDAFTLESSVLTHLISQTQYAISTDQSRLHLACALFERLNGALHVVATDGHRLSLSVIMGEDLAAGEKMMVPMKGVHELKRLCGEGKEVKIQRSRANAFFDVGAFRFSVKLVDATFPPYEQVIPKNLKRQAVVDRAALMDALKAVSLSANERTGGVKLVLGFGVLRVESESAESGAGSDEFEVDCDGAKVEIGLSARYMLDALGSVTTEKAVLKFDDPLNPVVVSEHEGPKDSNFVGVVMPMRI